MQRNVCCERCGKQIEDREVYSVVEGKIYCLDCEKKVIKEHNLNGSIVEDYDVWLHSEYTFHAKARIIFGFFVILFFIASILSSIFEPIKGVSNILTIMGVCFTADFLLASIRRTKYSCKLDTYLEDTKEEK